MTIQPSAGPPHFGWIGLGSMGIGMAMNLQKRLAELGFPALQYHNRTMSRGQRLQEIGGVARDNISELVNKSDIVFMSLSDDAALKEIVDRVLDDTAADLSCKVIVDTSTVHPKSSGQAHQRLTQRGMKFIAAPVFGASPVAAEGKLLWVIAGPDDAVQLITPFIVGIMGRRIIRLGDDVTQSSMLKTAGNFMTAGMMELVAEAHVFAEKTGLGTEAMGELIEHQYGPLALSMSKRLTTGAYLPGRGQKPWSDLGLALKDVGHGIDCAEGSGSRLEVAEVALRHLTEARAYSDIEGRPLDSSSMYGVLRREAGLSFETDLVKKRDNDDE
ncbi:Glyoxylate/succinic semialdehyde reductase 1 [Colletotrichum orbiculare MAFF 240422]|uniref:Glyoxylate/succinic semialdehyde reductase 1 n=1 Tax=Colletotrichum orbiculare (strain 104-T / ATCC 96160 / CBS 514.97 / LARS 414 / MAFF 240422) TaxID=1213857 RepID=A0A484FEW3_COLOR|nr:Glyoxylate/succinic semialdehyde reductase 1 [Colletotrichum orbiculare MAFF 240422]